MNRVFNSKSVTFVSSVINSKPSLTSSFRKPYLTYVSNHSVSDSSCVQECSPNRQTYKFYAKEISLPTQLLLKQKTTLNLVCVSQGQLQAYILPSARSQTNLKTPKHELTSTHDLMWWVYQSFPTRRITCQDKAMNKANLGSTDRSHTWQQQWAPHNPGLFTGRNLTSWEELASSLSNP